MCKDAGLDTLWFHELRRSFVTRARRAGIPESVVMRMSGHKTRAVFDRYNIVNEEDLRAAVDKLDEQSKSLINLGQDLDTFWASHQPHGALTRSASVGATVRGVRILSR